MTHPRYARPRNPKRATYDEEVVHDILDRGLTAHVGFIAEDRPMVIPMAYARHGGRIYLHGASKTRIARLDNAPLCVTVTLLDGIVAARSGMHHSVNYRSVVAHGTAHHVADPAEHDDALKRITEHLLPGRYDEIRAMTAQERKATGVIAMDIEHAAAKLRAAPPDDDPADHDLPLWSGVVPVVTAIGRGIADGNTAPNMPEPASIARARRKFI